MAKSPTSTVLKVLRDLRLFYSAFFYFLNGGSLAACRHFSADSDSGVQARVHLFSLAQIFFLWDKPHYRAKSFRHDLLANLCNVAIPGTGIPLSVFCYFKITAYLCVLVMYPIVALFGAIHQSSLHGGTVADSFRTILLTPTDWFSFWRLNSRLVALHSHLTQSDQYKYEDKWEFLRLAAAKKVAVSPFMECEAIIVKNRYQEGGLGIHKYKNALHGGDWIIQEFLKNSDQLVEMLPEDAPLSTFRVITTSTAGMESPGSIKAISCVFRAGRNHAMTDHQAILFDVDMKTGTFSQGTSNSHWYQLGVRAPFRCPWTSPNSWTHHPDNKAPITLRPVPSFDKILELAVAGHRLVPEVPICGWDVAFTSKGIFLLEANFSCNFFQATFDKPSYFRWVHDWFEHLETHKYLAAPVTHAPVQF